MYVNLSVIIYTEVKVPTSEILLTLFRRLYFSNRWVLVVGDSLIFFGSVFFLHNCEHDMDLKMVTSGKPRSPSTIRRGPISLEYSVTEV